LPEGGKKLLGDKRLKKVVHGTTSHGYVNANMLKPQEEMKTLTVEKSNSSSSIVKNTSSSFGDEGEILEHRQHVSSDNSFDVLGSEEQTNTSTVDKLIKVEQNFTLSNDPFVLNEPGYQLDNPIDVDVFDVDNYNNVPGRSMFRRIGYHFVTDMDRINQLAKLDTIEEEDTTFDAEFEHILDKHIKNLRDENKAARKRNDIIVKAVVDKEEFA
jgi:hypothetical protein